MDRGVILTESELNLLASQIADHVASRIEPFFQRTEERAVGREELAERLGIGIATVDRLVREGQIPSLLINSRRVFVTSKVFSALEADRAA